MRKNVMIRLTSVQRDESGEDEKISNFIHKKQNHSAETLSHETLKNTYFII